ncbi:hypothetical protein [Myxococcus stipitatus]|uniref:hypothetical protein n=1 Tax=Myxococcus stipitatus TaxID=83455 RepID=UPI0030CAA3A9
MNAWAGAQASEVVAGKRPLSRWRDYGRELAQMAESQLSQAKEESGLFTRIADAITGKVDQGVTAMAEKVRSLRSEYKRIGDVRARVAQARAVLKGKPVSAKAKEDLFGSAAARAEATWRQFETVLSGLEKAVGLVAGGGATLSLSGDGDDLELAGLGAVPVLAAGTVVATVALASSLGASLWAYFNHADEVARSELAKVELGLVAQGKGAEVEKLRALRNDSDKARAESQNNPFAALATAARWVGGGLLLGGVVLGVRELVRVWPKLELSASPRTSPALASGARGHE